MSDSLKDQLIALGLAKEKARASARRKKPHGGSKKKRSSGSQSKADAEISLDEAFRQRSLEEKQAARKARDEKLAEDRRRREVNQSLEALVKQHAVNDAKADLKRNFYYKGRIRSVLVNADQLKALNQGDLGVIFLRGRYFVVPLAVADSARKLSADHVPDLSGADAGSSDDGDHPVPDDLVW